MLAVSGMLALRGLRRLPAAFSPQTVTAQRAGDALTVRPAGVRSVGTAPREHTPTHHDPLVKMENPYKEPQKGCLLCDVTVDFKNIQLLSQFISPHSGRIYGRHITGLCGRKQKEVSKAIKKAHAMGFMSVTHKHPQLRKDPNICGIKHLD